MSDLPHTYKTIASATHDSLLSVSCEDRETITVSAPVQFGGPKGNWTPEDFFCASISSCFILTFKNYTRAKKLDWQHLNVEVDAVLEIKDRKLCFTKITIKPTLEICCEKDADPYLKALEMADTKCLVTNSLTCKVQLIPKIKVKAK